MNEIEPTEPRPESLRRANRRVVGIVLAIMALMATFGLLYSLQTVDVRRDRDPKPETTAERPRIDPKGP